MGEEVGKALYCRNCIARGLAREVCIAIHCCVLQQALLAGKNVLQLGNSNIDRSTMNSEFEK